MLVLKPIVSMFLPNSTVEKYKLRAISFVFKQKCVALMF